jgi:peroxiredoxin
MGMPIAVAVPMLALQLVVIVVLLRLHGRDVLWREELGHRLARPSRLLDLGDQPDAGTAAPSESDAIHRLIAERLTPSLPQGTPAPDYFVLPDLTGRQRSLAEFFGRPLLLVFFSPANEDCLNIAPEIGRLSQAGSPLLVISRGDLTENRRLAETHGWRCDVLLQMKRELAQVYKAQGSPTAYVIDAEGRIASELAVGAKAVLDLAIAGKPR